MIRIFKYLKSSILSILAIILLLFVQAYLDLTLPEYTSKIVNVGIQQSGIENVAIEEIGEISLDKLLTFVSEDDKEYVLDSYEVTREVNGESIYRLKGNVDVEKISFILSKPMTIILYIEQAESTEDTIITFDIPNNMNIYEALLILPNEQKQLILSSVNEKIDQIPDSIIDQSALNFVKNEYIRIGIDIGSIQTNYILKVGIIMIAISFAAMAVGVLIVFIGARMAARLAKTLREKVFRKVVGFSKNEIKKFGQSSLITRTTNDIQQVQMVILFLMRVVFYAPIVGIGGVIKAMNTNSSMTYIIAVALITIVIIMLTLFIIAMPKFNIIQRLVDKLNLVSREILTGLPVIRAFSNEKHEEERFDNANKNLTKVSIFVNKTMSFMMPLMMLIMNLVCLLIVYKGAYGVDAGSMQVGDIMAYIQYTMQIIMAFLMISMMSIMLPRANVSARRIMEVIDADNSIVDSITPVKFENKNKGIVEFKNVSFRYPDADYDVITDISFTANPGETTAFIGSTGSGKSTIVNLLPRFYDATSGVISIDGVNIKDISLNQLRDIIGFVPQKGILFTGSIKENIRYGNEKINDQSIVKALAVAQADDFIKNLKGGVDYRIAQGGTNVSGGQKQRLSIARAIAKNPDIYIFDDSFSALDFKTDAALRKDLAKITKNKTVLIVAQRISTIMNADKIIVLHEGKIVGIGTHHQLLKECKTYKEIALSQLSKEELDNA